MDKIIGKIRNKETLTDEDWKEVNYVLAEEYGWDEDDDEITEEDRIYNFTLILAKDKLESYTLSQLLEVIG